MLPLASTIQGEGSRNILLVGAGPPGQDTDKDPSLLSVDLTQLLFYYLFSSILSSLIQTSQILVERSQGPVAALLTRFLHNLKLFFLIYKVSLQISHWLDI